jgi:hypothetical protein
MRGRLERTTTKIAASARSVDLPPVLLAALKRHREAQERERQEAATAVGLGFLSQLRKDWNQSGVLIS